MLGQLQLQLSQDLAGDPKHIYDRKAHLAGDPKRKGWSPAKVGCVSIYKNWSRNNRMMEKMRNDEKSDKNA